MAHSAIHTIKTAGGLVDKAGGLSAFVRDFGLGGIALAFFARIIDAIDGFGSVLIGIPKAFGLGFILLIEAFFQGLADVFGAATAASVRSFAVGVGAALGPLAQPFGVGVVMLSVAVFIYSVNRLSISPFSFIMNVR